MTFHSPEVLVTKLEQEIDELDKKVISLKYFMASDDFDKVRLSEQLDLRDQLKYMGDYLVVLNRRLNRAKVSVGDMNGLT